MPPFDGCWDDYVPPDADERAGSPRCPRTSTASARAWGMRDGVAARRRSRDPRVRTALVAAGGHRHRDRRPSHRRIVEPDRRPRPTARVSVRVGPGQDPARSTTRSDAISSARCPSGSSSPSPRSTRYRRGTRAHRLGVRRRDRALREGFGVIRSAWVSAARSRSSVRSPTRSVASRRCSSVPPTRQPHPRRGREPPPGRLAQADRERGVAPRRTLGGS